MNAELQRRVRAALERSHRLGMIGGDLDDQLAHCASFVRVLGEFVPLDEPRLAADLGTGGGVPGVYMAAATPSWIWRLIEIRTGRADELERQVARLGLDTEVDVRPAQLVGQDPDHRARYDVVTAREFGPPPLVAECAAGLVRDGGIVVVSEPPDTAQGDRWPPAGLAAWGFGPVERRLEGSSHFAVLRKTGTTPNEVPRTPPRADRGWAHP